MLFPFSLLVGCLARLMLIHGFPFHARSLPVRARRFLRCGISCPTLLLSSSPRFFHWYSLTFLMLILYVRPLLSLSSAPAFLPSPCLLPSAVGVPMVVLCLIILVPLPFLLGVSLLAVAPPLTLLDASLLSCSATCAVSVLCLLFGVPYFLCPPCAPCFPFLHLSVLT